MNDTERAALVEELAEAIYDYERMSEIVHVETWERFCEKVGDSNDYRYYAKNCLPIIDRLLTTRPEPAADADAVPGFQRITPKGLTAEQVVELDSMTDELRQRMEPAADAEPEPGIPGTKMTGAYEAMMELSMYVGEEEWDSAQRHIRPASRRVSLRDAQSYTVAAYEKERQARENGDG